MPGTRSSERSIPERDPVDRIKRLVVIALFSDDDLMDTLVLKGGNALDLIHGISTRASIDIDMSMAGDFPGGPEGLRGRIENALKTTFREAEYAVFDVTCDEKPPNQSPDTTGFWGGYDIKFKLLSIADHDRLAADIDALRRNAIKFGNGGKFSIDISKHEFVQGKEAADLDGYRIFVYPPRLIVCEKLRAICQQLPEYAPIVHRTNRPGAPRARDFLDIRDLIANTAIDLFSPDSRAMLEAVFAAKKVPLTFLRKVAKQREFHRSDWQAVRDTVRPGVALDEFDAYFDFVLDLIGRLEPLGDE
jgi:hypothetical protein